MNERELFDALAEDCPNELAKHDAKVRADAIDETLEDLRKWLWKNDKCAYHYLNDYYIKPKREQLKEQ